MAVAEPVVVGMSELSADLDRRGSLEGLSTIV